MSVASISYEIMAQSEYREFFSFTRRSTLNELCQNMKTALLVSDEILDLFHPNTSITFKFYVNHEIILIMCNCEIFQAESVRDAAFGCDWVGTPIPFQRCLTFMIATANKGFQLTAGKFVPVSNVTTMNVCICSFN